MVLGPPEDGLRTILTIPRDGPDTQIWVSEGDPRVTHLTLKGSETWPDSGQVLVAFWRPTGRLQRRFYGRRSKNLPGASSESELEIVQKGRF